MNGIECKISDDGIVEIKYQKGGVVHSKTSTFNDFKNAINIRSTDIQLPFLPRGIRKYEKAGDNLVVALEFDAAVIADANYRGSHFENVKTPRSVWMFRLRDNHDGTYTIRKTINYALDMPLLSEDQRLYTWPFPNATESYGVCWGNDRNFANLQKNAQLINLSSLYNVYFSAAFNDDLGMDLSRDALFDAVREKGISIDRDGYAGNFRALSALDEFPSGALVRSNRTFSSAFSRFLNGSI